MSIPAPEIANPTRRRIMVVDPDDNRRTIISRFLRSEHDVVDLPDTDQALQHARGDYRPHLVLCALSARPLNGVRFVTAAADSLPTAEFALMTSRNVDPHLPNLRRHGIHNVLVTSKPFNFYEFRLLTENLLYPERSFGLRRYLREPRTVTDLNIETVADLEALSSRLDEFFRRYRQYDSDITEMRLASEELVNNAIFHAFKRPSGVEKYAPGLFKSLEPHEHVLVSLGRDATYAAVSVRDNQGSLQPDLILDNLERQFSLTGIMDLNGRGFYLTRQLCDRMIVNIDPGVASEIMLFFCINNRPAGPKPILINVVGRQ